MPDAKKPFFSITNDIDDEAIERVARAKGVPEMTAAAGPREVPVRQSRPPQRPNQASRAGQGAPDRPAGEQRQPKQQAATAAAVLPTPRTAISYVKAGIPDYALVELKTLAIQQRVSLNHILLSALKAHGITIRDEDLIEDGRRLRGKNAPNPDAGRLAD